MEILNSASQFLTPPTADSFFAQAAGGTSSAKVAAEVTIKASTREINRIRGYKLDLSSTDKAQLIKIQEQIQKIEAKTSSGSARADELEDRLALFEKADRILGKPTVDIKTDQTLAELSAGLDLLIRPKLRGAVKQRVESLVRIKASLEARIYENPKSQTTVKQFETVSRLLTSLTPPRPISSLSAAERRSYDKQAELINAYVGKKVELNSKEAIKVSKLQATIGQMQKLL